MLIDVYMKFREDSLNGHAFVTDAWGKNNMSPYPNGERAKGVRKKNYGFQSLKMDKIPATA